MAFVRWRGHCAQLLTTVYEQGRSRQILLANLHGAYAVSPSLQEAITAQFPSISVDWARINRALALGPPGTPTPSPQQESWLGVAEALRTWAEQAADWPSDRRDLLAAAAVLTSWHAREEQSQIRSHDT